MYWRSYKPAKYRSRVVSPKGRINFKYIKDANQSVYKFANETKPVWQTAATKNNQKQHCFQTTGHVLV